MNLPSPGFLVTEGGGYPKGFEEHTQNALSRVEHCSFFIFQRVFAVFLSFWLVKQILGVLSRCPQRIWMVLAACFGGTYSVFLEDLQQILGVPINVNFFFDLGALLMNVLIWVI